MIMRRGCLRLVSLALAFAPAAAWGEAYPARPVRIVVGFPPGGPLDIAARSIAPFLSGRLGQPFAVENRPGASGNTATLEVVRSAPDGYTLLLCGPVHTINGSLFEQFDFDFSRDIEPVAGIARVPLVVEVGPAVPARSVAALIALARERPGRVRAGYAGAGTPQHIAIEQFQRAAGVTLGLVAHAGSAPALAGLLEGDVDVMFDPAPSSMPLIRAGRVVPLATTGAARAEILPELPTVGEVLQGYAAGSWFGLGAPRGTPGDVVDALNRAVNDGLADAHVAARLQAAGATAMPGSAVAFGQFMAEETERYRRVILAAGLKAY